MITINKKHILTKITRYLSARKTDKILDKRNYENTKELIQGLLCYGSTLVSEMVRNRSNKKERFQRFFQVLKKYYYFFKKSKVPLSRLWEAHLKEVGNEIGERPIIPVDYTAIEKKFSKKTENLQYVWDGKQKKIVKGIKVLVSCALTRTKKLRVLMLKPTSSSEKEFKSENNEIIQMIMRIHRCICKDAIHVMDREMDRRKIIEPLLEQGIKFLIRLKTGENSRHLIDIKRGQLLSVAAIVKKIACPYIGPKFQLNGKTYQTYLGVRQVKLPGRKENLALVVSWIKGVSKVALITNVRTEKEKDVRKRVQQYINRFAVEEMIRFLKSELGMEQFMVRSWRGIQRILYILSMASDFVAYIRRLGGRWLKKICAMAKPIFPEREIKFIYYRLHRGISYLLLSALFDTG